MGWCCGWRAPRVARTAHRCRAVARGRGAERCDGAGIAALDLSTRPQGIVQQYRGHRGPRWATAGQRSRSMVLDSRRWATRPASVALPAICWATARGSRSHSTRKHRSVSTGRVDSAWCIQRRLAGSVSGWREGQGWRISTASLRIRGADFGVSARGGLWFQGDGTRPRIDIAADARAIAGDRVARLLGALPDVAGDRALARQRAARRHRA